MLTCPAFQTKTQNLMAMKKLAFFTFLVFLGQHFVAQGCNELFISEYCEGSGNNKALELYNPTGSPIDLGPYVVERWSNGEAFSGDETDLMGSIPAYGTWVLVNGQTEDIDIGGGTISPAVDPIMQGYADQLDNPYPAPTYMNGNDAIVIVKDGAIVVDIFGLPGEDPGVAWTDNADAGYTDEDGGAWLTANKTLRRKADIMEGTTVPPMEFFALAEYDSLPENTWDGLGLHTCACGADFIPENVTLPEVTIGPNPFDNGAFNINSNLVMTRIEVYAQNGQLVRTEEDQFLGLQRKVDINDFPAGVYVVNVLLENNSTISQRVIKK